MTTSRYFILRHLLRYNKQYHTVERRRCPNDTCRTFIMILPATLCTVPASPNSSNVLCAAHVRSCPRWHVCATSNARFRNALSNEKEKEDVNKVVRYRKRDFYGRKFLIAVAPMPTKRRCTASGGTADDDTRTFDVSRQTSFPTIPSRQSQPIRY
jgi:hypothetical protein